MPLKLFKQLLVVGVMLSVVLGQGTWALAGTTGTLNGLVTDSASGAPIANVHVSAVSASQTASAVTDGSGHFTFVSLIPDTYTVSVLKDGYDPESIAGVTVFADQAFSITVSTQKTLKTIAKVTSKAASSLVKAGTTADIYSVSAHVQQAAAALGGGGGLNNAFSAVASVPGVFVPQGQTGAYQSVFVRGGNYTQLGYEYDGVPIQRAFDQYPGGNLSNLGQQELQVYTGAPPVTTGSTALAGFINQVIKTGTYPGFGTMKLGVGSPVFYHQFSAEAGGASPNRNFSYYAGLSGYDQDFQFEEGQAFDDTWGGVVNVLKANCNTAHPTAGCYAASLGGVKAGPTGFLLGPLFWGATSHIADRDTVVNLHFGIPHKYDAGRDDLQVLYNNTYLRTMFASSLNDFGAHAGDIVKGTYTMPNGTVIPNCSTAAAGAPCAFYGGTPLTYWDKVVYNGATGVALTGNDLANTSPYYFPSAPQHAFDGTIPATERDSYQQNAAIVKLQYQRNINSNSFLRMFGYTAYSDWLQYGPGGLNPNFYGSISQDYKLGAHTRGFELNYTNQINAQHLLNVTGAYTTASTFRNNASVLLSGSTTAAGSGSDSNTIAFLVDSSNPTNGQCYQANASTHTVTAVTCGSSNSSRYTLPSTPGNPLALAHGTDPTIAQAAGLTCGGGPCEYFTVNQGLSAVYNTVTPKFASLALQDSWKPNDKLLLTMGLRYDDFKYGLVDTTGDPARTFWVNWYNRYNCIDPSQQGAVVSAPAPGSCPAPLKPVNFTAKSAASNDYPVIQPRLGFTYTLSPWDVLRASWGRYAQPASSAFQQYNTLQPNIVAFDSTFFSSGYLSPGHIVNPEQSYNLDGSWEHQAKNSDISFKVSPYLRKTRDEIITVVLDPKTNFVSGINVGRKTVSGVELAISKGDITKNGLFAQLSYTYTHARVKYQMLPNGTTVVDSLNNGIKTYNGFTKYCSQNPSDPKCPSAATIATEGAPCFFTSGANKGNADPNCTAGSIANPYWNAPAKGLFDSNAEYPVYSQLAASTVYSGSTGSYIVPHVLSLLLNYKHDRLNVTPSFQLQAGGVYGKPTDVGGINPRSCTGTNSPAFTGSVASNDPRYPYGAAAGSPFNAADCSASIAIPDPYTGNFDNFGAFTQPTKWTANLQLSYDVSPKVTATLVMVNVLTGCGGGSNVPWKVSGRAGCVYSGSVYPGNFYNPGDVIDQGYRYPYRPNFGNVFQSSSGGQANPFQAYFSLNVKL